MQRGDRNSAVPGGTDASKRAQRLSCAWHRFGIPWGNASYWLMQPGNRHSAVPGGRTLAKVRCVRPCAWHRFGIPWGNASYWLMQRGDRNSAVPGGRMLANVRGVCHVPGTDLGSRKTRQLPAYSKIVISLLNSLALGSKSLER